MIKNRFFNNVENIELEDIWLYAVRDINEGSKKMQYLEKIEYNIQDNFDCPLFSN